MRRKSGLMIVTLLAICTLSACGQKGPLTLPPVKPAANPAVPAPPATSVAPPPVEPATVAAPASAGSDG